MRFNIKYFLLTITLFVVEVLIATQFKNFVFLRAYLGDVLVVMLIYTFVLSFFNFNKNKVIIGVFLFAVLIEVLQYLNIAEALNLKPGTWQHIVVGSSFSWWDISCYGLGCLGSYFIEKNHTKRMV